MNIEVTVKSRHPTNRGYAGTIRLSFPDESAKTLQFKINDEPGENYLLVVRNGRNVIINLRGESALEDEELERQSPDQKALCRTIAGPLIEAIFAEQPSQIVRPVECLKDDEPHLMTLIAMNWRRRN